MLEADRKQVVERFESKFSPEPTSGCWIWLGYLDFGGYGAFWLRGKLRGAHRVAYELWKGPILHRPDLAVDHLCSLRCCVNPDHLEAVTSRENARRTHLRGRAEATISGMNRNKTQCSQGHPYNEQNTGYCRGIRYCRACHRIRDRQQRMKHANR